MSGQRPRSDLAARIVAEGSPSPTLAALRRQALAGTTPNEGALARRLGLVEGVKSCERPGCENPRGEGTQWLADLHHGANHVELVRLCEDCAIALSRWLYGEQA